MSIRPNMCSNIRNPDEIKIHCELVDCSGVGKYGDGAGGHVYHCQAEVWGWG